MHCGLPAVISLGRVVDIISNDVTPIFFGSFIQKWSLFAPEVHIYRETQRKHFGRKCLENKVTPWAWFPGWRGRAAAVCHQECGLCGGPAGQEALYRERPLQGQPRLQQPREETSHQEVTNQSNLSLFTFHFNVQLTLYHNITCLFWESSLFLASNDIG